MSDSKRRDSMEQALRDLESFRALRVQAMCSDPFQRDVSLPQLHLLATLEDQGEMTISELAGVLSASLPSASSIVDRLEDRDYVQRIRLDSDRRVVTVKLSDKGHKMVEEFAGLKREGMFRVMSAMTDDEVNRFADGLAAFRAAVDRAEQTTDREPLAS